MRTSILVLLSAFMVLFSSGAAAQEASWTDNKLVAHALGSIDGYTYTNTLEAFEYNYKLGHRVFEVDLQLTSDGYLISRHDWEPYLYNTLQQTAPAAGLRGEPLTLAEIKGLKVLGSYTVLEFSELIQLVKKYPDITFVTDTKDYEPPVVEQQFKLIIEAAHGDDELLHHIVPQVYNQAMYHQIDALYPFASYIYTLYESPDTERQVLKFVRGNDRIDAVTLPESKANSSFLYRLKSAGVRTYVHTINDLTAMNTYMENGTYGFYTDDVTAEQLTAVTPAPQSFKRILASSLLQFVIQPIVLPLLKLSYL